MTTTQRNLAIGGAATYVGLVSTTIIALQQLVARKSRIHMEPYTVTTYEGGEPVATRTLSHY